jgi:hypothetical protein
MRRHTCYYYFHRHIQNERHYSIIQLSLVFKTGIPLKFKRYEIPKHPNGGVFSKFSDGLLACIS